MISVVNGEASIAGNAFDLLSELGAIAGEISDAFHRNGISRSEAVDAILRSVLLGMFVSKETDFSKDITTDELINEYHKLMKEDTP